MPITENIESKEVKKKNHPESTTCSKSRQKIHSIFILDFAVFFSDLFFLRINFSVVKILFLDGLCSSLIH